MRQYRPIHPVYYRQNREHDEDFRSQLPLLNGLRRNQGERLARSGLLAAVFRDMHSAIRAEFRESLPYVIRRPLEGSEGQAFSIEFRHAARFGYFAIANLVAIHHDTSPTDQLVPLVDFEGLDCGPLPEMGREFDQLRLDGTIPTLDPHYFDIQ